MAYSATTLPTNLRPFLALGLLLLGHDAALAADNWRDKMGTFRIGLVGGNRPLLETRQVQPFKKAMQKALGLPVEIVAARDHEALIEGLVGSRLDYALLSATAFSAAWQLCKCVDPLVRPLSRDGIAGFNSVLITGRKGPKNVSRLRNKTIVVPGKHSFAGYLLPHAELKKAKVELGNNGWPLNDQKTMSAAMRAFKKNKGDALLGWQAFGTDGLPRPENSTVALLTSNEPSKKRKKKRNQRPISKDLRIIWKSSPVFHGPHTVRKSLAKEAKSLILETLTSLLAENPKALDAVSPEFGGGFVAANLAEYRPVIKALEAINSQEQARAEKAGPAPAPVQ